MSMLSDTDIAATLSSSSRSGFNEMLPGSWNDPENTLLIYPFRDELLTPVGYDLTIGGLYLSLARKDKMKLAPSMPLVIKPAETVLITTTEYVGLPKDRRMGGLIESKVSMVSQGFSHISTTLDNDWEGHLLISFTNLQTYPITLHGGDPFCTVMFFASKSAATKPCGKPAGRLDITEDHLDHWLKEARAAGPSLIDELAPILVQLLIIVAFAVVGFWQFGSTPGFPAMVALGTAISIGVLPAVQMIWKRVGTRRKAD
jgi:deoxycytidine triphosphate deaminase